MLSIPAYRVFISSTTVDLKYVRDAVQKGIMKLGHIPVGMENWPSAASPALDVISNELRSSDIYVGIVGSRYGSTLVNPKTNERIGYTEYEFEKARALGRCTLMFLMEDEDVERLRKELPPSEEERRFDEELNRFRERLKESAMVCFFTAGKEAARTVAADVVTAISALVQQGAVSAPGLVPGDSHLLPHNVNDFLRPVYSTLSRYELLTRRCSAASELKRDLAAFFWHYCFHDIVESKHLRLFFESGSTLAYVARGLIESMRRIRGVGAYERRLCISTNNLLVLFQFMFESHVPFYLCPSGRPDDKYGATYGDLDYAAGPVPGCDEPVEQDHLEIVDKMAEYIASPPKMPGLYTQHRDSKLLILGAASGMNCVGHNLGPHVGSYRNKLFKRALIMTGVPIILFLHAEKFFTDFITTHCYSVCGEEFTWDQVCRTVPIALCVGAESVNQRAEVLKALSRFDSFSLVSPERPRGDYRHTPFIVANELFAESRVVRGLKAH